MRAEARARVQSRTLGAYDTRTLRVTQPKASQYVFFLVMIGSVGAAWALPCSSIARLVIVCSSGVGLGQSIVQSFQA